MTKWEVRREPLGWKKMWVLVGWKFTVFTPCDVLQGRIIFYFLKIPCCASEKYWGRGSRIEAMSQCSASDMQGRERFAPELMKAGLRREWRGISSYSILPPPAGLAICFVFSLHNLQQLRHPLDFCKPVNSLSYFSFFISCIQFFSLPM